MNLMKILQLVEVIVTYMFRKVTVQEKNLDLKKVVQQFWGSIKAEAENRKFQEQFLEHQQHLNSIMDVVTNIQKQMSTKHDEKEDSILKQQLEEKQAEVERLIAA